jgi:hypothetical protein
MEDSILNSIKKILGLSDSYHAFDEDIIMHINSTFSTLTQLGLGPVDGFMIEDELDLWSDYITVGVSANELNSVRTYVFLKVRLYFDPPSTSYHVEAMKKQIEELEWRLNVSREYSLYPMEEV